ncbi:hypothetical protein Pan14r_36870 [Crateriforma conspicua]|uniref:Uncharacterized protein n=1 Tax=Crateriforma conspicua TaxID=2527996 RepID=A0A5C5Y6U3_9PLAN|nr:hypothetical protein Pan14r_36870 [Crateriforma conspicua]
MGIEGTVIRRPASVDTGRALIRGVELGPGGMIRDATEPLEEGTLKFQFSVVGSGRE